MRPIMRERSGARRSTEVVARTVLLVLRRPGVPGRRALLQLAAWAAGTGLLACAVGVRRPAALDVRLGQVTLWAPDVGWLMYAVLVLAVALLVLRVAWAATASARSRPRDRPRAPSR
jgi:hypothetical protein